MAQAERFRRAVARRESDRVTRTWRDEVADLVRTWRAERWRRDEDRAILANARAWQTSIQADAQAVVKAIDMLRNVAFGDPRTGRGALVLNRQDGRQINSSLTRLHTVFDRWFARHTLPPVRARRGSPLDDFWRRCKGIRLRHDVKPEDVADHIFHNVRPVLTPDERRALSLISSNEAHAIKQIARRLYKRNDRHMGTNRSARKR